MNTKADREEELVLELLDVVGKQSKVSQLHLASDSPRDFMPFLWEWLIEPAAYTWANGNSFARYDVPRRRDYCINRFHDE